MLSNEITRTPIRQLSTQLANQIAAGEVVERPASIVKELLENALDAGASIIEIDIQKGGLQLIAIRDNGYGIPKKELPLAVQAHCTSKITDFDDLTAIKSMGFRGEALASIVSISRFEITSCSESQEMAWTWSNENTNGLTPASHPIGTSIQVRDIFYNTMARRKFLRSERTEFRHIEDVVKRIALSRFDIEIVLKHNQRVVYRLPAGLTTDLKHQRIAKLLDKKFIQQALQVSYQASQLSMTGWLSDKNYSRGQTDMQYFYVNGRIVKDKVISHAVRQVYQALLPPGRFPAYILDLQLDPQQVDVNVHPTKHEVRFRQMRLVHDFINHVIQDAVDKTAAAPALMEDGFVFGKAEQPLTEHIAETSPDYTSLPEMASLSGTCGSALNSEPVVQSTRPIISPATSSKCSLFGHAVGFCKPFYLISQSQQGMVIIHLLRVAQHQLEQQWLQQFRKNKIETKPFVFPLGIELDEQLCDTLEQYQDVVLSLGFDLSLQTKTTVLLRAAPSVLQGCQYEQLVSQLLTSLKFEKSITSKELIQLLSRFIELDKNIENKTQSDWQQTLLEIETVFSELCSELPYKNKLWRILSITEVNKLFQANVSTQWPDD